MKFVAKSVLLFYPQVKIKLMLIREIRGKNISFLAAN